MFKPSKIKHVCNAEGVGKNKIRSSDRGASFNNQKVSTAVHPDDYTIGLQIGRRVVYHQNFGGAPIIEHREFQDECDFVKNLSTSDMKKMNAKADYLRLFE